MSEETKVIFRTTIRDKSDLKVHLKYDNLTQTKFFRACIQAYLDDDVMFRKWLDDWLWQVGLVPKYQRKTKEKNYAKVKDQTNKFALRDKEVEDIFDMLEQKNPDL